MPEPALIDPALPVGDSSLGRPATWPYWPSYGSISPDCRATYLDWLADGRRDPAVSIGCVFLFYYGLERRLLADPSTSHRARAQRSALVQEVERLLGIYKWHSALVGYATDLLDLLGVEGARAGVGDLTAPNLWTGEARAVQEYLQTSYFSKDTARVKVGLATIVAAGRPVPWDWALAWYCSSPERSFRTPAWRCGDEFRALFRARFDERFGDGLAVKPNKTRLKAKYRPASSSFWREVSACAEDLCDVTRQRVPLRKVAALVEDCQTELDGYSRWLGRNPGGRGTLPGIALLPEEVVRTITFDELEALRSCLDDMLGKSRSVVVGAQSLMERWPSGDKERFAKRDAVGLAQAVSKCGYGIEPDARFGGTTPKAEDPLVVFRLPEGSPTVPTESYLAAVFAVRLFIAVALADGRVSDGEHQEIVGYLKASTPLTPAERVRLRAHSRWLVCVKPGLTGMRRRMAGLTAEERAALGGMLVAVAGADGVIAPPEVAALTRIYRLLDLRPEEVHQDIHALAASAASPNDPVTVAEADLGSSGFTIPSAPGHREDEPDTITLDMDRVRAKLAETERVAVLLGSIFAEDEQPGGIPPAAGEEGPLAAGLDSAHSALLRRLAKRESVDRAAFERLCEDCSVLPDGALDALNDAALDACEESLCEGDDPIEINQEVLEEMVA